MGENQPVTKIYCDDRGGNDNAMVASMMGNQWMNNPFAYMMMIAMTRLWGNNGWGGNGNGNGQLNTIQNQLQDNHNNDLVMAALNNNLGAVRELAGNLNCDINAVNAAICAVRDAITAVGGQVGLSAEQVKNAVLMGNQNVISAVKDCCCSTQLQMCQQTNQLQKDITFVNSSVERGFASLAYENKSQTCELINNQNAGVQRIIDTLNGHWIAEDKNRIQKLELELSQSKQNQLLLNAIRGGNCGCGCGNAFGNNGCGCGCN